MITPQTAATRALAVSMAAASDINDQLTIILNSANRAVVFAAAMRASQITHGLIQYAARRGGQAVNVPMEKLIPEDAGAPFNLTDTEMGKEWS